MPQSMRLLLIIINDNVREIISHLRKIFQERGETRREFLDPGMKHI